jgi:hypothetical protein
MPFFLAFVCPDMDLTIRLVPNRHFSQGVMNCSEFMQLGKWKTLYFFTLNLEISKM